MNEKYVEEKNSKINVVETFYLQFLTWWLRTKELKDPL